MKLDWKDCKFRSIADSPCGKYALCACQTEGGLYTWSVHTVRETGLSETQRVYGNHSQGIDGAKADAEKWLDEQDWPVWQISTLAASATWRGFAMVVYQGQYGYAFHGFAIGNQKTFTANGSASIHDVQRQLVDQIRKSS